MNKKGNLYMLGIMFCVMLFTGGIVLLEPIKEVISDARTSMSCGTAGLDMYTDMACIVTGSMLPIFALAVVGIALAAIKVKNTFFASE